MKRSKAMVFISIVLGLSLAGCPNPDRSAAVKAHGDISIGMSLVELFDTVERTQIPDLQVFLYTVGCDNEVRIGRDSIPYYIRVYAPAPNQYDPRDYHEDGFAQRKAFLAAIGEVSEQVVNCPKAVIYMGRLHGWGDGDQFEVTFDSDGKVKTLSPLIDAPF